jgi:ankyrin repeat protein
MEERDERGYTGFLSVYENGHFEIVKYLILNNCQMEAKTELDRYTAFLLACANGHLEIPLFKRSHSERSEAEGRAR